MKTTGLHDEVVAMLAHIERSPSRPRNAPEALIMMLTTFDRGGHYWQAMSSEVRLALIEWLPGCTRWDEADALIVGLVRHDYDLKDACTRLHESGQIG